MDGSVPRVFATERIILKIAFVRVNGNQLEFIENSHWNFSKRKLIYANK